MSENLNHQFSELFYHAYHEALENEIKYGIFALTDDLPESIKNMAYEHPTERRGPHEKTP